MKKNKTLAYTLAAALLIGGTFAGTKAWFTSENKIAQDISIEMGKLSVASKFEQNEWQKGDNTDIKLTHTQNGVIIENAKPGDKITRAIEIENNGTLKLDAVVEVAKLDALKGLNVKMTGIGSSDEDVKFEELENGIGYKITNISPEIQGDNKDMTISAHVEIEIPGEEYTNEQELNRILNHTGDFITVTAEQQGKK